MAAVASAQEPNADLQKALNIKPIQKGIEFDEPTAEELKNCEFKPYDGKRGFIVIGPNKNTLRLFLDADGSGHVNQWSYFRNGIEVYRDIDSNGNRKADQYRWLNNAGTRWGIDQNEDGIVDSWKEISPEEVSQEVMGALATNDAARFLRVALSKDELKAMQLGEEMNAVVAKKVAALQAGFAEAVKSLNFAGKAMVWYQFAGGLPGTVPAGDKGNKNDVTVFENATATIGVDKETKQLSLGTVVKVGDNSWRVIDAPKPYDDAQPAYTFILPGDAPRSSGAPANDEVISLIREAQEIQNGIAAAAADKRPEMHREVALRILKIINKATTTEDRELWIRQLADTIMAAGQANEFPQGGEQLKALYESVKKEGNPELAAFIRLRQIMTDYYTDIFAGKKNNSQIQSEWLANLEEFAGEYEKTDAGVEGMMQLASYRELVDKTLDDSVKWYKKVAELAAGKPIAEKAKGAILRLTAKGKAIPFSGKNAAGQAIDIASLKGSFVLLYFWDSRSTVNMPAVKAIVDRYADKGLKAVGVNIDMTPEAMQEAMPKTTVNWPQIVSPGGLDSPAAVHWGVQTTPLMILYGKDGTVLNPNILSAEDLESIMGDLTK